MKRTIHKAGMLICFTLVIINPTVSSGADEPVPEKIVDLTKLTPEELMKIEVATVSTASRFEQKVTEAPSSVSIVTSDEIRKYGYRTLADILRSLKGFYITYDRDYMYAGVRGFGRSGDFNSRILLLIDGHRINDNLYDSAPLGTEFPVDVDLIERVEVIRGPGSSLYGSNAFFAVINVLTRRGKDLKGVEVSGETGSFDTNKGRLSYGDSYKNGIEAMVSGTYYNSSGPRLFYKEFADPATNGGMTGHTDFDRFHKYLAKVSYGDFLLEAAWSNRTKGVPTASFGNDFNDRRNRTTDEWWFADLQYKRKLGDRSDIMARLYYDSYNYRGISVTEGIVSNDQGHGRRWGGEAQFSTTLFDKHKIIIGSEYRGNLRQDQKTVNENPYESIIDDKRRSSTWAFYLQDEFTIFKSLILNAGIRYDHYSDFGGTVNPRLALIYTPVEGTVFKLLYGTAFRAPNVLELYYTTADQKGNPDLGPEKIKTYELIFEQYIGRNIRASISGFYYKIGNLITEATDPDDGRTQFRNLNKAEAKGVEAELEGKWDNGFAGRVSYTFQKAKDGETNQPLVNSPQHLAKLNLTIPLMKDKVFLGIEEQFTSRRQTLTGNHAGSHFITNLTLFSRNLLKNLELSASLYNLFNQSYGDPGGSEHIQDVIQQDGRAFRVKLTYRF